MSKNNYNQLIAITQLTTKKLTMIKNIEVDLDFFLITPERRMWRFMNSLHSRSFIDSV